MLEWLSTFTVAIRSPKGRFSCRFSLVQMYKSLSLNDMDVKLEVSLGAFEGDCVEGVEEENDCKVGEKIGFDFDGG